MLELLQTNMTCVRYSEGQIGWAVYSLIPILSIVFQAGVTWANRRVPASSTRLCTLSNGMPFFHVQDII